MYALSNMHLDIVNTCKDICITKCVYTGYRGIHLGHAMLEVLCRSARQYEAAMYECREKNDALD